ncbi:MAG: PSD1 domain-containing protein [Planctomyces sp.]|nr:PSD1 domain-containing protein [Planctomyces sp.]
MCVAAAFALLAGGAAADEVPDFTRDVLPIFERRCIECHGADDTQQDLRLDSFVGVRRGGNSGSLVRAGDSQGSLLMQAVTGAAGVEAMPPEDAGERLSAEELDILRRWIDAGGVGPADAVEPPRARRGDHWSFQPIRRVPPPEVSDPAWSRSPIDRHIHARLADAGLHPSPEADRATLIRRLSLDLLGLPPSPTEVAEFVNDPEPDAYMRLVERVLASPRYGERWGRHWLDQARYADSNGYTIDSARSMWKYRDWVIDSLNRDLPFDVFATEQLAGDLLPDATLEQRTATGFHRNTLKNEEGGTDPEQFRVEAVADRVSTVGSVFLGLTLGCARCHDHKYDPISQREFYQLFAIFNSTDEPTLMAPTDQQMAEEAPLIAEIASVEARLATVEENSGTRQKEWERQILDELSALEKDAAAPGVRGMLTSWKALLSIPAAKRDAEQARVIRKEFFKFDAERIPLIAQLADLNARKQQLAARMTTTLVVEELPAPRKTHVHIRGDFLRPGAEVDGGTPAALPPIAPAGERVTRLDFARWLFTRDNPLTARVTANRVWQAYFGRGLVETENDFGLQGDAPTHPELLDALALMLIDSGWSLKTLHLEIVTSATYRQSSAARSDLAEADPYNLLLGRQSRLRLEAEVIRDSALAASGRIIEQLGGPGVYPPQPEGIYRFTQQVKYWKQRSPADHYRRGLYTFFWRSSPYPFLVTFDAPDANVACTRRARSNTPLQSLTLANDRVFVDLAAGLAERLQREASGDDGAWIDAAFRFCFARESSSVERERLLEFLREERARLPSRGEADDAAAWTSVARVLFNLDEFVTRE